MSEVRWREASLQRDTHVGFCVSADAQRNVSTSTVVQPYRIKIVLLRTVLIVGFRLLRSTLQGMGSDANRHRKCPQFDPKIDNKKLNPLPPPG